MIQILKSNLKKKYSFSHFNKDDTEKYFKIIKKILIVKQNRTECDLTKFSKTETYLFDLMIKKNLNLKEQKNIISYYKKFNVHLKLKKYDYQLKKSTEQNCHPRAYLFLGINIIKNKIKIYNTHKLNTLLKIIDICIIKIDTLNFYEIEILKKLIRKSFELINKF